MSDDVYLVWSNEHMGWWKAGGWGYGRGLNDAGRFTRAEAIKICRNAIPTANPVKAVAELPVRLEDVQDFIRGQPLPLCILYSE